MFGSYWWRLAKARYKSKTDKRSMRLHIYLQETKLYRCIACAFQSCGDFIRGRKAIGSSLAHVFLTLKDALGSFALDSPPAGVISGMFFLGVRESIPNNGRKGEAWALALMEVLRKVIGWKTRT